MLYDFPGAQVLPIIVIVITCTFRITNITPSGPAQDTTSTVKEENQSRQSLSRCRGPGLSKDALQTVLCWQSYARLVKKTL